MLTGSHCGSCSPRTFWLLKTLICQSDGTEIRRLWTDLGVLDKQHKLYIFRIYSWSGWHLRSCSLAAHALPHALLAFAFTSAGLQKQRDTMRGMYSFTHGGLFDVKPTADSSRAMNLPVVAPYVFVAVGGIPS